MTNQITGLPGPESAAPALAAPPLAQRDCLGGLASNLGVASSGVSVAANLFQMCRCGGKSRRSRRDVKAA